jgi:hypothetical protein
MRRQSEEKADSFFRVDLGAEAGRSALKIKLFIVLGAAGGAFLVGFAILVAAVIYSNISEEAAKKESLGYNEKMAGARSDPNS